MEIYLVDLPSYPGRGAGHLFDEFPKTWTNRKYDLDQLTIMVNTVCQEGYFVEKKMLLPIGERMQDEECPRVEGIGISKLACLLVGNISSLLPYRECAEHFRRNLLKVFEKSDRSVSEEIFEEFCCKEEIAHIK